MLDGQVVKGNHEKMVSEKYLKANNVLPHLKDGIRIPHEREEAPAFFKMWSVQTGLYGPQEKESTGIISAIPRVVTVTRMRDNYMRFQIHIWKTCRLISPGIETLIKQDMETLYWKR